MGIGPYNFIKADLVKEVVHQLAEGKAVGGDGLAVEALHKQDDILYEEMASFFSSGSKYSSICCCSR